METQTQKTDLWTQGLGEEGEGGTNGESNMETYTLPYVKQIGHGNFLYDSGNSNQGSVTTSRGRMGREVEGRFRREGTQVYLQLIHVDIWQKPTQYCRAITLQLKINKFNYKKVIKFLCQELWFPEKGECAMDILLLWNIKTTERQINRKHLNYNLYQIT